MNGIRRDQGFGGVPARRGIAALVALACLSFSLVVGTLLMKSALAERQYAERLEAQYQADWLVEAGLSRGAARLSEAPHYTGETWSVPVPGFRGSRQAVVQIDLKADRSDAARATLAVSADLTGGGATLAHVRREIQISVRQGPTHHP
jgi:hypothetical protein